MRLPQCLSEELQSHGVSLVRVDAAYPSTTIDMASGIDSKDIITGELIF